MSEIKDRTVLITGAASGLGQAWAEGFARAGARVFAADVNEKGLELLSEGITSIACDVSKDGDVREAIDLAVNSTGRLDVLFNNAGYGLPYMLEDYPIDTFEQLVAVHLFGTVYGMRAAIPIMRKQGYGRIINTISRHAEVSATRSGAYGAAKAAIWSVSRSTAKEVAGSGILINMLIPGPTNTGIWGKDMPDLQSAEVTYPTALMLATLDEDGPTGVVYWDEQQYQLFESLFDTAE